MLQAVTEFIWSYVLVVVLIGIGLAFTVRSRFVQLRHFGEMFRVLGQAFHHQPGHVSSFQALALSVAGRVGAGNIAGVAVAITLGGPGAIFWMWVIGLLGMSTSFFECTLAQVFKNNEPDGTYRGGPAYYMVRGARKRWLATAYSVLLLITFGMAFVALQSFTASSSLRDAFGIPVHVSGIAMTAIVGAVIFGGVKRIASVTEIVVPLMAVSYILIAVVVVLLNLDRVPHALEIIFKGAFGLDQAIGGGLGAAIMMGARRGLFSNEAGLGSGPNVAAVAWVPHPVNQGIVQMLSVFIDTVIICSSTAFIIIMSDVYIVDGPNAVDGVVMTQAALADHVGGWGRAFVSFALMLFAFSSILYNYYLGENSLNYFSEENKHLFHGFRVVILALTLWGSMQDLTTVFAFADLTMALVALTNITALALLMSAGMRVMNDYDEQRRTKAYPVFDPDRFPDLDIDREAWKDAADSVVTSK
ncbi:MAG: alanine/glycine:cation symporter family protein [Wenzhouxiangellaceae bacterium]|nr:alanine/glycine:cation symporter family protein [Wenzhouxiangellaceae bacterium]